ncbi:MAG TPA: hypothetical protein VGG05_03485 [Pseudonocardiaceae bacterium]
MRLPGESADGGPPLSLAPDNAVLTGQALSPIDGDDGFAARMAALLRSIANDLKRNDADADTELGLEPGTFAGYVTGQVPVTWAFIEHVARRWPVNERDLLPVHNDVPRGVLVVSAESSQASGRIIDRGSGPYYRYCDTATTRLASYRPELIEMLVHVDDNSPDNSRVAWNEGHLLYQFTYFVGDINYYFQDRAGRRHCAAMTTGDSVWGAPWAPHSFTARGPRPTHILALTYGTGLVGDPQQELSALGNEACRSLMAEHADRSPLAEIMNSQLMTVDELAARTDLPAERVADLASRPDTASLAELGVLASALGMPRSALLPALDDPTTTVNLARRAASGEWHHSPSYRVRRLAHDPFNEDTSALELTVLNSGPGERIATHQHSYLYVLSAKSLDIRWTFAGQHHQEVVGSGDSLYVVPGVALSFAVPPGEEATVVVLRVGGAVGNRSRAVVASFAPQALRRYLSEDRIWYTARDGVA